MDDINRIWDMAGKLGSYIHAIDEIKDKKKQVDSVSAIRCGNCKYWMTRECAPEKQYNQFKSMYSQGCKDFSICFMSKKLQEQFKSELEVLKEQNAPLFLVLFKIRVDINVLE